MPDITVIRPNGSPESALEETELAATADEVRLLGFPKSLFEYDVAIDRRFLADRETSLSVTVDLLTGTCRKNDTYPDLQPRTLSSTSLLNPRLERDTAADTAHTFVRRTITQTYTTFTAPRIDPVREETVFKLFWVVPAPSSTTVTVIDTITNRRVAEDVALDEFTADPSIE
jgi:hypothetical protein